MFSLLQDSEMSRTCFFASSRVVSRSQLRYAAVPRGRSLELAAGRDRFRGRFIAIAFRDWQKPKHRGRFSRVRRIIAIVFRDSQVHRGCFRERTASSQLHLQFAEFFAVAPR